MIVEIKAAQDQGKTLLMVLAVIWNVVHDGYRWDEVCGNVCLPDVQKFGYRYLSNSALRDEIKICSEKHIKHRIFLVDEVDLVFPPRFFKDKEQTETLLGLFQDVKQFWIMYCVSHLGKGMDKIMRDARQIVWIPHYDKRNPDVVPFVVIDGRYKRVSNACMSGAQFAFTQYDRWQSVG